MTGVTIPGVSIGAVKSSRTVPTHPRYNSRIAQWIKCRDAFEGEDQIKSKGETYLPRLKGQSDDDYKAYKRRALFYSITSKSLAALVGMSLSAGMRISYPAAMVRYFEDSTMIQFSELIATVLQEVMLQSRVGIMIEAPEAGGNPYPVTYIAEDIVDWTESADGMLEFVRLREEVEIRNDTGEIVLVEQFRELSFDSDGYYQQRTIRLDMDQTISPTFAGYKLNYIPFYAVNPIGVGFKDLKPMMLDIANINISHYLSSADLEHGRHFTGLPTPVITGGEVNGDLHIGSTKFLVIPTKGSDAKYLEFTGQGLQSLEKAMAEKQGLLASMSARLLDNSSRGSEAAEAVKLRYSSETASLKTVVEAVNKCINSVYRKIAEMLREDPNEVSIILGTDFMESYLSPTEMTALFDGYFNGAVSVETLVYNMRKGRRLDPLVDDKDVLAQLNKIAKDRAETLKNQPKAI